MYTIRKATAQDWPGIWTIFEAVVKSGETYPYATDTSKDEAKYLWMKPEQHVFVAVDEGEVVGTYYIRDNQPTNGAHVCNAGYMVRKDQRGRGLGRALCEHSLQAARDLGYRAMQYNLVVSTNPAAVHLWQKLGFEIVGTLAEAFLHAQKGYVDAYIMYRLLDSKTS
ncbi:MAG: GNAT family N-acetyltransferase [Rhodospirillaceae bacterium]|nr:MAG: GNAT family N-acetyltransferase [Rhodospirillaceae bacterium]